MSTEDKGVGFRFDICMTPGDPAADKGYAPSPEEAEQALADAEQMDKNMREFGAIDRPIGASE